MAHFSGIKLFLLFAFLGLVRAHGDSLIATDHALAVPGDFVLSSQGHATAIYIADDEPEAVRRAADDLINDVARVTDAKPARLSQANQLPNDVVIVGTIEHSKLLQELLKAGIFDTQGISGAWESYVIQVVEHPLPNVEKALVVAGSDRRGTIYGLYAISEAIGVSPWSWWADVPVKKQASLVIHAGSHKQGPPAVKYRGIFLNDEDWGLQPWAAKTLEPETGDIGPKTYARLFELLLRLRANTLWPAMHPCTHAFNYYPDDKQVADHFGIVMGASHCEQMLRNNIDEWHRDGKGDYNYVTNRKGVLDYWEARVKENAPFENVYTVGMRGIHDGGMPGGGTLDEKAVRLKNIITDQREMLRKWVNPDPTRTPQIFCPYKEVLDIYRRNLELPDDITLVWPDDNYGYVRQFSNDKERQRKGGAGVYYHISYWGAPYDYLWLCTTPPALIWEEMSKAWDYGARTFWVVNVGDLKPAELSTEFFLRLAWNPHAWTPENVDDYLASVVTRDFGPVHAEAITALLRDYYRLNFARRPEHLGIDPGKKNLAKPLFAVGANQDEAEQRLAEFSALLEKANALESQLSPELRAAYYQLVLYPIRGSALANDKGLNLAKYYAYAEQGRACAADYLEKAKQALTAIHRETEYYNQTLSGGKWNHLMSDHPRDQAALGLPKITPAAAPNSPRLGLFVEGSDQPAQAPSTDHLVLPSFSPLTNQKHFIDVFNTGKEPVAWKAETSAPWIQLSQHDGAHDGRIWVTIDWTKANRGSPAEGFVEIAAAQQTFRVKLNLEAIANPPRAAGTVFGEDNLRIVIHAAHTSARRAGKDAEWKTLRGVGYTGDSVMVTPTTAPSPKGAAQIRSESPCLEYQLWISSPQDWRVTVRTLPTWALVAGHPQNYAVSFDEDQPIAVSLPAYTGEENLQWQQDVLRNATLTTSILHGKSPGLHTLKVWMVDPGIVVDAIMLDANAGKVAGYLWPAETRISENAAAVASSERR